MRFEKLHEMIPYATGTCAKLFTWQPYDNVTLALPGRHAKDTDPVGGDFVVMVTDEEMEWDQHQFTHTDLFLDLELKMYDAPNATNGLMLNYLDVIQGQDPAKLTFEFTEGIFDNLGIDPHTFLYAVQCLAVAEHRRYRQHEAKLGGRYLPFRFSAGIVEELWSAADAAGKQRRGRIGVEWLEKDHGRPILTQRLFDER